MSDEYEDEPYGGLFAPDDYDDDEPYCYRCNAAYYEECTCCRECDGTGRVPTMDYECYLGAMWKPCPACGGTG